MWGYGGASEDVAGMNNGFMRLRRNMGGMEIGDRSMVWRREVGRMEWTMEWGEGGSGVRGCGRMDGMRGWAGIWMGVEVLVLVYYYCDNSVVVVVVVVVVSSSSSLSRVYIIVASSSSSLSSSMTTKIEVLDLLST